MRFAASVVTLCALAAPTARAETFVVNPEESIQAAIDMATDGDEVVLMPGTYTEAIDYLGKAITVRSDQGADVTILSRDGLTSPAIAWQTGEGRASVVRDLTIDATQGSFDNAMTFVFASPTFDRCTFLASGSSYGMWMNDGTSAPLFQDCDFIGDMTGRIASARSDARPTFERCTFIDLYEVLRGTGVGVFATFSGCTIERCGTSDSLLWAPVYVSASTFTNCRYGIRTLGVSTVKDCTFTACVQAIEYAGELNVLNSTFDDNRGRSSHTTPGPPNDVGPGAAIASFSGGSIVSLTVQDSTFRRNSGGRYCLLAAGGAISAQSGQVTITGCLFEDNISDSGGAVRCTGPAIIRDSIFRRNTATGQCDGGGALLLGAPSTIIACTFESNVVLQENTSFPRGGGAIQVDETDAHCIDCTFIGNRCLGSGAALTASSAFNQTNTTTLDNCSAAGNTAAAGAPFLHNNRAQVNVNNCAIREFGASAVGDTAVTAITNSILDTPWPGPGANNLIADPSFIRRPAPGADDQWGTPDDDYGDLRLASGSPCIDAGDNALVPADSLDLDNDGDTTEPMPFDLDGNPRFIDATNYPDVGLPIGAPAIGDIGAYEAPADLPPPCPCETDADHAHVNVFDLLAYLNLWFDADPRAELTADDPPTIDVLDLLAYLQCWFPASAGAPCP